MKRIIFTYGGIAGLVIIGINTLSLHYGEGQAWLGFLVMFIAFSTIFVAVKQHRDQTLGGVIAFTPALLLGLGISAVAGVVYVVVWELYLALTDYSFIERYAAAMLEARKESGASDAELAALAADTERFRQQYLNPFFRLPMTFLEIFPVGALISLLSAAVLRNRRAG